MFSELDLDHTRSIREFEDRVGEHPNRLSHSSQPPNPPLQHPRIADPTPTRRRMMLGRPATRHEQHPLTAARTLRQPVVGFSRVRLARRFPRIGPRHRPLPAGSAVRTRYSTLAGHLCRRSLNGIMATKPLGVWKPRLGCPSTRGIPFMPSVASIRFVSVEVLIANEILENRARTAGRGSLRLKSLLRWLPANTPPDPPRTPPPASRCARSELPPRSPLPASTRPAAEPSSDPEQPPGGRDRPGSPSPS